MTILRLKKLTAKSRANNLKEHKEGFDSVNKVGPEPLPDFDDQVSGILSELLQLKHIKLKEVTRVSFEVRKTTGKMKNLKHCQVTAIIANLLGYQHYNEMSVNAIGEDRIFTNRNYGKCLLEVEESTSKDYAKRCEEFKDLCLRVFIYVKSNDFDIEIDKNKKRIDNTEEWYMRYVDPITEASGITVDFNGDYTYDWTPHIFSMALAAKYKKALSRDTWKSAFRRIPGLTSASVSRKLSEELMECSLEEMSLRKK